MAFTVTLVKHNVAGNERISIYDVTADAASGVIGTNIGVVDGIAISPISMATAGIKLKPNLSAASSAANGNIMASSCASGDRFFVTVFGHG